MSERLPYAWVEIELEGCALSYGVGACTAAVGVTGPAKCYNTYATCQAKAAMNANRTPKILRFADATQPMPDSVDAMPLLTKVSITPTRIDREKGLGPRESVTITLADTTFNDAKMDPYLSSRSTPAIQVSTFWPKMLARMPYWHRRPLTLWSGFLGGTLVASHYVIDKIDGPNAKGEVTITAKDVLALADDDKQKAPVATGWALTASISSGATAATIVFSTGPTSGTLVIGDEAMLFTRSGTALTLTRAQLGTVAEAHDAGASLQVAYRVQGRIDAVLSALLIAAGVDAAWIPTATWTAEADAWAPEAILDGWIVEPTGVLSLIKDLCQQTGSFIWWDARTQLVQLRFLRPGLTGESIPLDSESNLLATKLALTSEESRRLTEIWIYHGLRSVVSTETGSKAFSALAIAASPDAGDEDGLEWRAPRVMSIKGRYIPSGSLSPGLIAGRYALAYRSPPLRLSFVVDGKDAIGLGSYVRVTLRGLVNADGISKPRVAQVLEVREIQYGHAYECMAEANGFDGRYAVQMADGQPDYVSPGLDPGGFQSDIVSGTIAGDDPYLQV